MDFGHRSDHEFEARVEEAATNLETVDKVELLAVCQQEERDRAVPHLD